MGLLCLLVVIYRRYTPHVHCHGSFSCVRLCLPSLLYAMSYTLFRALYDEFLAGCCYVDHTFAVGFPMPVCYNAGFHMHFVICSPMHTSRTFTVCPLLFLVRFAISCSKHFSRQNPLRPPRLPSGHDAFIRFLCIHSGYATCLPCVRSL